VNRVYFDPNFKPSHFYPLIKPLCVIYDQVLIWSPVQRHLEDSGFSSVEFLRACQASKDEPPVIIPLGRDHWFNREMRRRHPDVDARDYDVQFESSIHIAALAAMGVLPSSDYRVGNDTVDHLLSGSAKERERIEAIVEKILPDYPSGGLARAQDVAYMMKKDLTWGVVNNFVQDIRAISLLGATSVVVRPEQAAGYLVISPENAPENLAREEVIGEVIQRIESKQEFPELPPQITAQELIEFIDRAFGTSHSGWDEVISLRKHKRAAVRRWLRERLETNRRPLGKTVSEVAALRAESLRKQGEGLVNWAGSAVSLTVFKNRGLTEAILTQLAFELMKMTKLYSPVVRAVAKRLGYKLDRFLVDTPFYQSTE
jgi:hypothetical protein